MGWYPNCAKSSLYTSYVRALVSPDSVALHSVS